jgi:hypothetical protein
MKFVEYPIGIPANAPAYQGAGILRCFRSPLLSDIIEAIWDCDIPDGDFAKALTVKCAPGTSLQLIGQPRSFYRRSVRPIFSLMPSLYVPREHLASSLFVLDLMRRAA